MRILEVGDKTEGDRPREHCNVSEWGDMSIRGLIFQ
jgi:hypothetical protein